MASVSCDISGQFKARDISRVLAEARRERADGRPYRGMDGRAIDPTRSGLNQHYRSPRWSEWNGDPRTACTQLDEAGRKHLIESGKGIRGRQLLKEDSVLMRGIVIQASPEFFFPEMTGWTDEEKKSAFKLEERGAPDPERVKKFWDLSIKALQERYGDYLLEAHLHLDESSPHIHAEIIPYNEKKLSISNNALFPGAKSVTDFHTWLYEKIGKPLGMERSQREAPRDPFRPAYEAPAELKHRELLEREAACRKKERDVEELIQDVEASRPIKLDKLPPELIVKPPIEPEKPGIFASKEDKEDYKQRLSNYKEMLETRPQRQQSVILERLNKDAMIMALQRKDIRELKEENDRIKRELERREEQRREESTQLREIPLVDVIETIYPDQIWRDPQDKTQWRTSDGRKIGITAQKFIDNHDPDSFKGRGAIDFVMKMEQCTVKEAIAKLRDYYSTDTVIKHATKVELQKLCSVIESIPPQPEPEPPAADPSRTQDVRRWMLTEQAISPATVEHLVSTGQVYADSRANAVIARPGGGAVSRGTVKMRDGSRNAYKRTTGSRRAGAAVLTGPQPTKRRILAEGLTDALALADMHPDAQVFIVGGNMRPDLPPLQGAVFLAFDNDEAGREHARHYLEQYPDAQLLPPPAGFKDWAEAHQAASRPAPERPKPRAQEEDRQAQQETAHEAPHERHRFKM